MSTMKLGQTISEFEILPRGYAVAYWQPHTARAVCYPVGLHALVSISRAAWLAFRAWHAPDVIERAYNLGRLDERKARELVRASIENDAIHRFVLGVLAPAPVTPQEADRG